MMTFNAFADKHNFKNKATSNLKIKQALCSIGLDNFDIYLRDGPFSGDIGVVILHPSKVRDWVAYINGNFF